MIFKRLKVYNFQSWRTEEFNFPKGFILFDGWNFDEETAEGAGKSGIFNAICWCLYNKVPKKKIKLDNLIHWGSKGDPQMEVELEFEIDNKNIIVQRTRGPVSLKVFSEGVLHEGGFPEQYLLQLLGLSYSQFIQICYVPQNLSNKRFLYLNDTDKKDFLSTLLSLEDYDNAYEKTKKKLKTTKSKLDENKGQILGLEQSLFVLVKELKTKEAYNLKLTESTKTSIETNHNQIYGIKESIKFSIEAIDVLKKDESESIKNLSKVNLDIKNLNTKINSLNESIFNIKKTKSILELEQKLESLINSQINAQNKNSIIWELQSKIDSAEQLLNEKNYEFTAIHKTKTCPTCKQKWGGNPSHEKKVLSTIKKRLKNLWSRLNKIKPIDPAVLDIQDQIQNAEKNLEKTIIENTKEFLNKRNSLREDLALLEETKEYVYRTIMEIKDFVIKESGNKGRLKNHIIRLESNIEQFEKDLSFYKSNLESFKERKEYNEESLKRHKIKRQELEKLFSDYEIVKHIYSPTGVKGYVFESIIEDLNNKVNYYLSLLFNDMKFTLEISSITSAKQSVQKFNEVIVFNGRNIDIGSLSGGESKRLCLAVDLAISDVISKRNSVFPNIFFLDEPFEGLSDSGREAIYNLLKELVKDKHAVYVIDHATSMKGHFYDIIKIEKKNGVSKII